MSDAEWTLVRDLLPMPGWLAGRGGRPEGYCHRQVIDAVRYLVDNGIKWRAMPFDFPPWPRVYAFFARWRDAGLVAELHDRLRGAVREAESREEEASAAVVDSQSVKADATVAHGSRGYDAGKKINGGKRHLLTDTLGLLLDVAVTPASTTDRDAARILLPAATNRLPRLSLIWADGGYRGHLQDWAVQHLGLVLDVVRRSDDVQGFEVLPRRWVVERSFAWLLRSRRLVRDYERRTDTSEAVIRWSMTMLMSRRLITACRDLDKLYPDRRLWAWAHMLGFRGHFSSKSRRYSTTLGALRQARADFRAAQEREALGVDREPDTVLVLDDWQYAGHGHTPGESALAATIARDLQLNRETAREALAALPVEGEW